MFRKIKNYIFRGNNESGRSMVEMLGVLAVIGVLTIGGLAGYNYAMEKHKVNELIDGATKRAVVASASGKTGAVSLKEFEDDTVAGGTFGDTAMVSAGKITLTVSGVETKICERLKTTLGENAIMAVVEECGTNPLTLVFNHDLRKGVSTEGTGTPNTAEERLEEWRECESDSDCTGPCEKCLGRCIKLMDGSNGCTACADNEFSMEDPELGTACFPCTLNDYTMPDFLCNQCSNREYDITRDMCLFKNCPSGYTLTDGECFENCQTGYIRDIDGKCISCNASEEFIEVPQGSNCATVCTNRALIWSPDGDYACASKCETGYERPTGSGECLPNCPEGQVRGYDGDCIPCNDPDPWGGNDSYTCSKCTNREMNGEICELKCEANEIKDVDGNCIPCNDSEEFIEVFENSNCESICDNRELIGNEWGDHACALKCSTDEIRDTNGNCIQDPDIPCQSGYVRDLSGRCRPCSDSEAFIEVASDSDCESVCNNRILIEKGEISQYFCMIRCDSGYILNYRGECVSCDASSGDVITVSETRGRDYCGTQCPNREGKRPGPPYNGYLKDCTLK